MGNAIANRVKSFVLLLVLAVLLLSGCSTTETYAPVTDITRIEPIPASGESRVRHGESVYEIAWRYGLDYRSIIAYNDLKPPYLLKHNQMLLLRKKPTNNRPPVNVEKKYIDKVAPKKIIRPDVQLVNDREPDFNASKWVWPAKGKIIGYYSRANNGINIAGKRGTLVRAALSGKVVYAGSGISGYGNLIIIKHNSTYLSAYAHNDIALVKEGDWVKQGQVIAKMGDSGAKQVMLHFEVRRAGVPINPLNIL